MYIRLKFLATMWEAYEAKTMRQVRMINLLDIWTTISATARKMISEGKFTDGNAILSTL